MYIASASTSTALLEAAETFTKSMPESTSHVYFSAPSARSRVVVAAALLALLPDQERSEPARAESVRGGAGGRAGARGRQPVRGHAPKKKKTDIRHRESLCVRFY